MLAPLHEAPVMVQYRIGIFILQSDRAFAMFCGNRQPGGCRCEAAGSPELVARHRGATADATFKPWREGNAVSLLELMLLNVRFRKPRRFALVYTPAAA